MDAKEKMKMEESEFFVQEMLEKRNRGTEDCVTTSEIARKVGISTNDLNSFLQDKGVLFRRGRVLMPTERFRDSGYLKMKSSFRFTAEGKIKEVVYPVWTTKGVEYLGKVFFSKWLRENY